MEKKIGENLEGLDLRLNVPLVEFFSDAMAKTPHGTGKPDTKPINRIGSVGDESRSKPQAGSAVDPMLAREFSVSAKDAARMLGIGQQSLLQRAKAGDIPYALKGIGPKPRYWFRANDIETLLNKTVEIHGLEDE